MVLYLLSNIRQDIQVTVATPDYMYLHSNHGTKQHCLLARVCSGHMPLAYLVNVV
jgi:hypothetical protein